MDCYGLLCNFTGNVILMWCILTNRSLRSPAPINITYVRKCYNNLQYYQTFWQSFIITQQYYIKSS